jgi:hypothetical protein
MKSRQSYPAIKQRPFELLGLFALLFLLISFIPFQHPIDINIHDSYFVFPVQSIFIACAFYFLFVWSVYLVTNNVLFSVCLTRLHVAITISLTVISLVIFMIKSPVNNAPKRYYSFGEFEKSKPILNLYVIYAAMIVTTLLAQLLLPINIVCGLLKNRLH